MDVLDITGKVPQKTPSLGLSVNIHMSFYPWFAGHTWGFESHVQTKPHNMSPTWLLVSCIYSDILFCHSILTFYSGIYSNLLSDIGTAGPNRERQISVGSGH